MCTTEKKLRTPEVIELIRSEMVVKFKRYISEYPLRPKAIEFLFEEGSDDMVEAYINTVYPSTKEFVTYQNKVIRFANRKTLATYYTYAELDADGQIELIKRNEVNAFAYYLANKELLMEAFIYLINSGSEEMVECYINNNSLVGKKLDYFLRHGKVNDISWYFDICSNLEREVFVDKLSILKNTSRYDLICNRCQDIEIWLDC